MKLKDIIKGVEVVGRSVGAGAVPDVEISSLTFDSREVGPGAIFFALRGTASDGHDYIASAIEKGAAAVVCESSIEDASSPEAGKSVEDRRRIAEESSNRAIFIVVPDSHKAMGQMASAFYGHPSRRLKLVGVTGTNGKTTTATLLYDAMRALGYGAGLVSTVDYRIGDEIIPSTHTTPDPLRLNAMLAEMVAGGCEYCFMEVSSHAVVQERIAGLRFAGAAFTNITHDHLDYHGTFAAYIAAKKKFFDDLPLEAFAVTNVDDRNGRVMIQNTHAKTKTISLRAAADYRCKIVEQHLDGMLLHLDGTELWVGFIGRFNAYNLLTVYACMRELAVEKHEALKILSALRPVRGRFETIHSAPGRPQNITAIVDYAHTPDALQNVLDTIAGIRRPSQKIFTVVGCGGDRDQAKRPVMARIAATGSDMAILTSDNPRTENPADILAQMKAGLEDDNFPDQRKPAAITIADRREAIRTAAVMASPGDIILIAGKGHETYQIVGAEKHHFDDREEITEAFKDKNA